jgi:hypothetical protein
MMYGDDDDDDVIKIETYSIYFTQNYLLTIFVGHYFRINPVDEAFSVKLNKTWRPCKMHHKNFSY